MRKALAALISISALALVVPAAASADETAMCGVGGTTVMSTGATKASCSFISGDGTSTDAGAPTCVVAVAAQSDTTDGAAVPTATVDDVLAAIDAPTGVSAGGC